MLMHLSQTKGMGRVGFSWLAVGDDALMMPIIDMMNVNDKYDDGDNDEYDDEDESLESLSLKNQSSLNTEQVPTINMTR